MAHQLGAPPVHQALQVSAASWPSRLHTLMSTPYSGTWEAQIMMSCFQRQRSLFLA